MDLRELQLYKLNILRDITAFCDQNNVRYVLAWGTLLGAVRHGGFIPWDDDVDIAMPWKDYQRFLKVAKKSLSPRYFVQNYHTDPAFPMMFTQIRVNGTTSMPVKSYRLNTHWGVCIDIFPLVGIWESKRGLTIQKKLFSLSNCLLISDYMTAVGMKPQGAQKMINRLPRCIRRLGAQMLMSIGCCGTDQKQNYFSLESGNVRSHGKKSEWTERIKWEFEGEDFWIPKAYDAILTKAYGNYMVPPPVELQGGHELTLGDQIVDLHKDYALYQQELWQKQEKC